jgi:AGCS family alanine or glycine:cation symporter
MTALALIITGVWNQGESDGITLTADAFELALPGFGAYLLTICVAVFAVSTMISFPYYGTKCFSFIFGAKHSYIYKWLYIIAIPLGSAAALGVTVSIFDGAYALMAFPTMISAILLAPRVMKASKKYFQSIQ